jgi:hypothetical protein
MRIIAIVVAIIAAAAIIIFAVGHDRSAAEKPEALPRPIILPSKPESYLGVYAEGVPESYADVKSFTTATGIRPSVVSYYSGWREPFRASFATTAAKSGAVPLVQMEPLGVSLAAIASGQYDTYLTSYAEAVRSYSRPVIISFCHEMNGDWYPWGYRHASPAAFVAAWRHIVTTFRAIGALNVTWMWTVNITGGSQRGKVPSPAPWWPGDSYVNWVGIDGYYSLPSQTFAPLFGSTIVAVRELTRDPILIAETGVALDAGQPTKITDLFAGIHTYGLLGLVWFDSVGSKDWQLNKPGAIVAFRREAGAYKRPAI